MRITIAVLLLTVCVGCRHRTYYKDYEDTKEGLYIYWMEYKPVSNRIGVCAEVYSTTNKDGSWGGENHRRDAPWDPDTKSHVGFARLANQKEAEAWGDKVCPN